MDNNPVDLLVVGAGPIGLACAVEAQREGLQARIIEKGSVVNSLIGYPTGMEFFSTPDLLEIGGHPLPSARYKPVREEVIDYYLGVVQQENLDICLNERVLGVSGENGSFEIETSKGVHRARKVAIATGFFDQPNLLDVPGASLKKVSHYYKEPFAYSGQNVAVIGAKNSAAKVALDCYRHGAHVTLIHRGPDIGESVKYWIRPDLQNRIGEGSIAAHFNAQVTHIDETSIEVQTATDQIVLENDWVLAMTGYHPDFSFLSSVGIDLTGDEQSPSFNPDTMETNRTGIFIAGTVCGGRKTSRWFIENGRIHAARIAARIAGKQPPSTMAKGQP